MGGDNGEKGGRVFRDIYKGYMNKTKGSGVGGGDSWGCLLYTSDAADDPRVV